MVGNTERGFTVIEVMLFLAITGGLFAALMVSVNVGVTQQRYLDSVRSYKSLLQNQYSEVLNTRNVEDSAFKCTDKAVIGNSSVPRGTRGTSSCVILGRAIQIDENGGGKKITTSSVIGYDNLSQGSGTDELTTLNGYLPKLSEFDTEINEVDWGGHLTTTAIVSGEHEKSTAVILILRSPATGTIRFFTSQTALGGGTDLRTLITPANLSATAVIENCVLGDSGLLPKQMVKIDPRIASADAVTIVSDDDGRSEACQ
jgi:type II secretory pathway pseudopilin PulG